jgi:hypothetical protein
MHRLLRVVFCGVLLAGMVRGAAAESTPAWTILATQRQVLVADVAYYQFLVAVGPGPYDKIRVHRVVREQSPHQPMHLSPAIMFFPGEPTYFASLYIEPLISKVPARDRSIAIYLAKNNIDVWGMDYRWALVPENTTDFGFMKDWNMSRDAEDGQIALSVARSLRGTVLGPAGPLYVSGLSYGAQMTYAVAANDTQRPPHLRNVKGIIPLDCGLKFDSDAARAEGCAYRDAAQQTIDSGTYYNDNRSMWQMGQLAITNPQAPSPFDSTVTNYQFALEVAAFPEDAVIPWHFAGARFRNGLPYDLRFTEPRLWFDILEYNEPPYYPVAVDVEGNAVQCDDPGDPAARAAEHLGDITVPILYVGAAGGFGHWGDYTTTLTASQDVTIHIVQMLPDDLQGEDYGHVDLLAARDAPNVVWPRILAWLQAHR